MPAFFQVLVGQLHHSDLYPEHQQDRYKVGYVAVKSTDIIKTQETAKSVVNLQIATEVFQPRAITWEDENWTGKNGWKAKNSFTVL